MSTYVVVCDGNRIATVSARSSYRACEKAKALYPTLKNRNLAAYPVHSA